MYQRRTKNIYLAASPLQLICIKEYIIKHKIKKYELILFLHNTKHKDNEIALKQIFLSLTKLKFNEYKIFWIPKIRAIRFLFEILLIINLKRKSIYSNLSFIIFDFRNIFLQSLRRHFKNSKFILIDDGFYTYVAQENYMQKDIFLPIDKYKNIEGRISKLLYFGFSFKRLKKTPIKIFSIYADEISNPYAEMNTLSYLRSKAIKSKGEILNKLVYFTGTGMVERGALRLDQELSLIQKANQYWAEKGKTLYYIGKRSTSRKKLDVFERNGIKTLQFSLPLEIVLTERDELPGHICTLGSTLQKSLSLIFNQRIKFYFINITNFFDTPDKVNLKINTDEVDISAAKYSTKSSRIATINLNLFN